jgi:homoserine O-acetyltransferase
MSEQAVPLVVDDGCTARREPAMLVEKQRFELPEYRTLSGRTLRDVAVGWECYGRLNEAADNVVLVPHFFSATSHAAGRYSEDDPEPGYWDAMIGPGKLIDTDRYCVIGVDCLSNMNAKDPRVISTGPASIDPDTGRPYGMRFPVVTIRDFVEIQRRLLLSLGVERLHAVMGVSMGSMQAMEWAVAYPEAVERAIAITPHGPAAHPYAIQMINGWMDYVRLDPNWQGGDYCDGSEPVEGVVAALKSVLLYARHQDWARSSFGKDWADPARDPLQAMENVYCIEQFFEQAARTRARSIDANAFLYLCKANQLFHLGHDGDPQAAIRQIRARLMVIPERSDRMLLPEYGRELRDALLQAGKQLDYIELDGGNGHLDGVFSLQPVEERISRFLEQ